jgi:hypothetical protein
MRGTKAYAARTIVVRGVTLHFEKDILHCTNMPSVIYPDGTEEWWIDGRRQRKDGFAIMSVSGLRIKISNGKLRCKYRENEELVLDTKGESYISAITRTYHFLKSLSLEELNLDEDETIVEDQDIIKTYYRGMLHCESRAAVMYPNGTELHYQFGVKHCANGPAIIDKKIDSKYWYQYGMLHREDGPAVVKHSKRCPNRIQVAHYMYGLLDRRDGPAYMEFNKLLHQYVHEVWYKQGVTHRDISYNGSNGPAMYIRLTNYFDNSLEKDELKCWFENGKFHRVNGPAQETDNINIFMINDVAVEDDKYKKIMSVFNRFCYKIKSPLRKKFAHSVLYSIEKGTILMKMALCKDMCDEISKFVY